MQKVPILTTFMVMFMSCYKNFSQVWVFFIRKYCNGVYLFVNLTINYASGASLLETEFEFMNSLFVMICIYICFVWMFEVFIDQIDKRKADRVHFSLWRKNVNIKVYKLLKQIWLSFSLDEFWVFKLNWVYVLDFLT